jgi:hypothetical protein
MENDFIEEPVLADDDDEEVQISAHLNTLFHIFVSSNYTAIPRNTNMIN